MVAAQRGCRRQFLATPVQPEARHMVTGEQRSEAVTDEGAGRGTVRQCLAQDVEVHPGAPGQQSLDGSDGLTEPQQVDQQLGQVPGYVAADMSDVGVVEADGPGETAGTGGPGRRTATPALIKLPVRAAATSTR
jgi:hypothetical protein